MRASEIIHRTNDQLQSSTSANAKITALQQKHKELRKQRRENQHKQVEEQNLAASYEVIEILFSKKILIQVYRAQSIIQMFLLFFGVLLIFEIFAQESFDYGCILRPILYYTVVLGLKNHLFPPIKYNIKRVELEYKRDKQDLHNGLPIREKRDFSATVQSGRIQQFISVKENKQINFDNYNIADSPSPCVRQQKKQLSLKQIKPKNITTRELFSNNNNQAQLALKRMSAVRKKSSEMFKDNDQFLNFFNVAHLLEINGLIQILLIIVMTKFSFVGLAQRDDIKELFISGVGCIALAFLSAKLLQNTECKVLVHLFYFSVFTEINDDLIKSFLLFSYSVICVALSLYFVLIFQDDNKKSHYKKAAVLLDACRYGRIIQNVRSGYGILNYSMIHFCNDQFFQILGTKTKAQAIHILKSIKRKIPISIQQAQSQINQSRQSQNTSEKGNCSQKVVSVMEDILNILRNKPVVEINEDIEYSLERVDHRTNQKYLRFFYFSFQYIQWDGQMNILICVKDITQDKKILEQRLVNQLRNMMFKSFTHEIKTPLNGVVQTIDLTNSVLNQYQEEKLKNNESVLEYIQLEKFMAQISSGVQILQNNLNDLIDYQLIESGTLKVSVKQFNLKECYDTVIRIMKPQLSNKNVKFQTYFDQSMPLIMDNDQERLIRIIVNMLLNAQKFTQRGFIRFEVKQVKNKRSASKTHKDAQQNYIRFEVSDSGLGIPEEKLPYIFNLFESDLMAIHTINQSNSQKSAKVGLPISQHLCQKMGGFIQVRSKKDKGSKFWFKLPLIKQQTMMPNSNFDEMASQSKGLKSDQDGESISESESRECDVDPYESDSNEQRGLPEDFALTSQMLNQNILLSFFPANLYGNSSNSEEEGKYEEAQSDRSGMNFQRMRKKFSKREMSKSSSKSNVMKSQHPHNLTVSQNQLFTSEQKEEIKELADQSDQILRVQSNLFINQLSKKSSNQNNNNNNLNLKRGSYKTNNGQKSYDTLNSHFFERRNQNRDRFQTVNTVDQDNPTKSELVLKLNKNLEGVRKIHTKSNFRIFKSKMNSSFMHTSNMNESDSEQQAALINNHRSTNARANSQQNTNNNTTMLFTEQENLPNLHEYGCQCAQILIVDDIDMNRYILREIIKSKFGLVCDEAINGKECLSMIKQKSFHECCCYYKIIFMDFEMPIMNGIEASKKIKKYKELGKADKNIVIVGYTAYLDEEQSCIESGMNYFLPKPASLAQITALLREINMKPREQVALVVENEIGQETFQLTKQEKKKKQNELILEMDD